MSGRLDGGFNASVLCIAAELSCRIKLVCSMCMGIWCYHILFHSVYGLYSVTRMAFLIHNGNCYIIFCFL